MSVYATAEEAAADWQWLSERGFQPELLSEQAECWTTKDEARAAWRFFACRYMEAKTEADRRYLRFALSFVEAHARLLP